MGYPLSILDKTKAFPAYGKAFVLSKEKGFNI
jgi:hypothetical protein